MHLTPSEVCDHEYRSAMRAFRPSPSRESAASAVRAPVVVSSVRATPWVNASNLDVTRSRIVRKGCVVEFPGGVRATVTAVRMGRFWHLGGMQTHASYTPCASVRVVS